ncbi:MAG TPA: phenylalanine--tRNA ligase beta subunit-related protein [Acidimicrobiales bacterium]
MAERHPDVLVGGLVATGLQAASAAVADQPPRVDTQAELLERGLTIEKIASEPIIADWRTAIAACGLKPSTFKSSPEQLARRMLKSGPLHTPLPLVDLYCDVATRHLAPMGAYDLSSLPVAQVALRLARPGEDVFHPLGARDDEMPISPQVAVYAAGNVIICWAYNCRDSRDTCLTPDTDVGLFLGEAVTQGQQGPLRAAFDDLAARLAEAGANVGPIAFASATAPAVDVSHP